MNNIYLDSFSSLIDKTDYEISILSNTSSFLNEILDDINWVGFYLYKDSKLILGPFQGLTACTEIALGKGVCGYSAEKLVTTRVDNVHNFSGHIACDSRSNSEIVIPIIVNGNLYGVLDIDSPKFSRFSNDDQIFLERIVQILSNKLSSL